MNEESRIPSLVASLADPSRLRVVSVLAEADCCVSDLARRIGLSQSCTTRHLQILQRAGVLSRTRQGKRVLFRIRDDDPELDRVLELMLVRRPLDVPSAPPSRPQPARTTAPAIVPRRILGPDSAPSPDFQRRRRESPDLELVAATGGMRPNEVPMDALSTQLVSDLPIHSDSPFEREGAVPDRDAAPTGAQQQLEDYLL